MFAKYAESGSGNDNSQSGGGMVAKRGNATPSSTPTVKPSAALITNGVFRAQPSAASVQNIVTTCAKMLKKL